MNELKFFNDEVNVYDGYTSDNFPFNYSIVD